MSTQYPEDEFDEAGKLYPVGAYRQAPSKWKAVLPFLLVLLLAPALAWAAVSFLTSGTSTAPTTPNTADSQQATEKSEAEKTEAEKAAAEKAKAEEEAAAKAKAEEEAAAKAKAEQEAAEKARAAVNKDAAVVVLNGTGVNGLAGGAVSKLQGDGFNNLRPDNAQGWQTEVTTVYFKPGNEGTAKAVAKVLGVNAVVESTDSVGDITVVLKSDYQP